MTECPHCGASLARISKGKTIVRVQNRALVIRADGGVEINCGQCKEPVDLQLHRETPEPKSSLPSAIKRSLARRVGSGT